MSKFKIEDTGFFVMEDANKVMTMNFTLAKLYCMNKIQEFAKEHPNTHAANLAKADKMIHRARSCVDLAMGISNFVLAHTSENLAII